MAAGDLGEEDCGLGRLPLAEQDRLVPGGRFGGPMGEQLAGVGGDAVPVIGAPDLDLAADVVDQGVLFPALPGGVEVEGLLGATSTFPGGRDRDEGLAGTSTAQKLPGWSGWSDLEVGFGRLVRRVDDGVADVGRRHTGVLLSAGRRYWPNHPGRGQSDPA